jgi:hypothetical protein
MTGQRPVCANCRVWQSRYSIANEHALDLERRLSIAHIEITALKALLAEDKPSVDEALVARLLAWYEADRQGAECAMSETETEDAFGGGQ